MSFSFLYEKLISLEEPVHIIAFYSDKLKSRSFNGIFLKQSCSKTSFYQETLSIYVVN